ncbi:protein-export chaperone SecB [Pseudohoeflea coraliihabitans]|uniref:Protein-export protein SecB n=1 Tax=Pseudohoeflea coraliihabitans TaxID=2860393 RepID=A0ABS6WUM2_9HYPH|nr:protein-export chaperone SecB [Pseudohoeflea sp. DP4N28-3]MBW3099132.1 protein-export chaperone SecB [Pseudohoeflea sp. DP4N28-3]
MAEDTTKETATSGAEAKAGAQPTLNVQTQYVKDLSFENPGAPKSLSSRNNSPAISVNVNVNANPLSENEFDVILTLNAEAKDGDNIVFNVELVYGGVFRIANFPQEHMLPLLFIECPRLLFPFARQIVADATRNGGFPPLMIDPIDFAQMFQQRMAAEQAKQQREGGSNGNGAAPAAGNGQPSN